MKHKILAILAILISGFMPIFGQTDNAKVIKPMEASMEDYISLLNRNGYEAFSFDLSSLLDGKYEIVFILKEYKDGKLVSDNLWADDRRYTVRTNMNLLSDFPKEMQEEITPEEMVDPEKGIMSMAKKITVGFAPGVSDSVKNVLVELENMSSRFGELHLYPQYEKNDSVNGKRYYMYYTKPFKMDEFCADQFIPLVLLGSAWYDKNYGIHRFCGENEMDPDMSTGILQDIPHYYVVGIEIKPVKLLN